MSLRKILLQENTLYDYLGYYPDEEEVLWDFVGGNREFENNKIDPPKKMKVNDLYHSLKVVGGYERYADSVGEMEEESRKHIIDMRKNIESYVNDPIIIFDDELIDGYHRLVAFYLEGVEYCYVLDLQTMDGIV